MQVISFKSVFVFLILFIASCHNLNQEDPNEPSKQSLATEVLNQTILQLREKGLRACGYGSGMMYQIRMLALSFDYYKEIDINEARELLMTAATVFLNNVNSHDLIPPFLQNYPFTPQNIEIRIFIYQPNGNNPEPGKLVGASMIDGILKYKIMPDEYKLETIYQETFDEAKLKLNDVSSN